MGKNMNTQRRTARWFTFAASALLGLSAAGADVIDDIGSISLRLRASDLALSDGDPVAAWGSLTQATTDKQPTFVLSDSQFGGASVVNFDGILNHTTGDAMTWSGANLNARTIYAVANAESGGNNRGLLSRGDDRLNVRLSDNSYYRSPGHAQDGNDFTGAGGTGSMALNGINDGTYTINAPHVVTLVSAVNQTYTNFAVGNGQPQTSGGGPFDVRYWDGQIAEILIFNRELTFVENYTVLSQLRDTYGLPRGIVRGTGAGALIGGDSTDPENDGNDVNPAGTNFNANFFSNQEAYFSDAGDASSIREGAFDVFDNKLGGGEAKWCCGNAGLMASEGLYVGADFVVGGILDRFTIASSNDSPLRDAIHWAIQGSLDGSTWTDIFVQNAAATMWTARDQVIEFRNGVDYLQQINFSQYRYIAYASGGTEHALGELEFFVIPTPAALPAGMALMGLIAARRRSTRR